MATVALVLTGGEEGSALAVAGLVVLAVLGPVAIGLVLRFKDSRSDEVASGGRPSSEGAASGAAVNARMGLVGLVALVLAAALALAGAPGLGAIAAITGVVAVTLLAAGRRQR